MATHDSQDDLLMLSTSLVSTNLNFIQHKTNKIHYSKMTDRIAFSGLRIHYL